MAEFTPLPTPAPYTGRIYRGGQLRTRIRLPRGRRTNPSTMRLNVPLGKTGRPSTRLYLTASALLCSAQSLELRRLTVAKPVAYPGAYSPPFPEPPGVPDGRTGFLILNRLPSEPQLKIKKNTIQTSKSQPIDGIATHITELTTHSTTQKTPLNLKLPY